MHSVVSQSGGWGGGKDGTVNCVCVCECLYVHVPASC